MRYWIALFLVVYSAGVAIAGDEFSLEPMAKDTYGVLWVGRSIASCTQPGCITCAQIAGSVTDNNPTGMVGAISVANSNGSGLVSFVINPTNARKGSKYQCRMQPTDADGNQPTKNLKFTIEKVQF